MLLENSLWDMQPAWRLQQSPLHLPKDLCFGSCRSCLCCTTWKLGAPSSQTLLAKREVKKEMEKGLLYFQRSCRVRKKKYYVENWGAKGKQSWLLRLASEPWQLTPPDEWISEEPQKTQLNHAFWHRKCNKNAKEKGQLNSISMGLKSEARHKPTPIAMPFFATFLMGCYKEKAFCLA